MVRSRCCSGGGWTSLTGNPRSKPPARLTTSPRRCNFSSFSVPLPWRHQPLVYSKHCPEDSMALAALPMDYSATQMIDSYITTSINHGILAATTRASLKLGIICVIVGWLLKMNKLPRDTSNVLSKVAFNLCIPAALFINVAQILTAQRDMMLFWIPVAAAIQICFGILVGIGAVKLVEEGAFFLPGLQKSAFIRQTKASPSIASSTAIAIGNPKAAEALIPQASSSHTNLSKIVLVACAFGNTLTLPLIYLLTLLPASMSSSAMAFVALFLVGWSPIFWSLGYFILTREEKNSEEELQGGFQMVPTVNKPMFAGMGTPSSFGSVNQSTDGQIAEPIFAPGQVMRGAFALVSACRRHVLQLWKNIANPPIIAIMVGIFVGCTPIGKFLFSDDISRDALLWTSTSVGAAMMRFCMLGAKTIMDVLQLMGDAVLPLQAIILSASLFPSKGEVETEPRKHWWSSIVPKDVFEQRALIVVSLARLVLMPCLGVASVMGLSLIGAMPWDPVCHMCILLQSTMPPAQNLILMLNVNKETQQIVPQAARFLIRMYLISILPITFWTTVFAVFTGVQLA